jgi:hypothetical protein
MPVTAIRQTAYRMSIGKPFSRNEPDPDADIIDAAEGSVNPPRRALSR